MLVVAHVNNKCCVFKHPSVFQHCVGILFQVMIAEELERQMRGEESPREYSNSPRVVNHHPHIGPPPQLPPGLLPASALKGDPRSQYPVPAMSLPHPISHHMHPAMTPAGKVSQRGVSAAAPQWWDRMVQSLERSTENPGAVLTRVRFPSATRDLSSRVTFHSRLSYSVCTSLWCTHTKSHLLVATPLFGHPKILRALL